jgi:EF hand
MPDVAHSKAGMALARLEMQLPLIDSLIKLRSINMPNTTLIRVVLPLLLAGGVAFAAQENAPAAKPGDPPNIPMGTQANQPAKPAAEAPAQSSTSAGGSMKSLDRDGDGQVTKAEAGAMSGLTETFDSADKDKNGSLDAAELKDAMQRMKK